MTSDAEPFLARLPEAIDLPSSGGKRILDRYLNMFVPCILRRRAVDENVFVRRNCKPDMDLKPGTVTVLLTRCDHSYAASDDVMIMFLQLATSRSIKARTASDGSVHQAKNQLNRRPRKKPLFVVFCLILAVSPFSAALACEHRTRLQYSLRNLGPIKSGRARDWRRCIVH